MKGVGDGHRREKASMHKQVSSERGFAVLFFSCLSPKKRTEDAKKKTGMIDREESATTSQSSMAAVCVLSTSGRGKECREKPSAQCRDRDHDTKPHAPKRARTTSQTERLQQEPGERETPQRKGTPGLAQDQTTHREGESAKTQWKGEAPRWYTRRRGSESFPGADARFCAFRYG